VAATIAATIEAHSACCPRLNLKNMLVAIKRLNAGDGCRWCLAHTTLCQLASYVSARNEADPKVVTALLNRIQALLDTEPGPTRCWACQRARRDARAAHNATHAGHALCPRHAAA
jgi:hypothetical protein